MGSRNGDFRKTEMSAVPRSDTSSEMDLRGSLIHIGVGQISGGLKGQKRNLRARLSPTLPQVRFPRPSPSGVLRESAQDAVVSMRA